jgi:hypothetical protein
MVTHSAGEAMERSESGLARDASKLVLEHPIPVYDPPWLRRLHTRCLWDGGSAKTGSDFCSDRCEERYTEWEHLTVHVLVGREPLETFYEQGRELGG